MGADSAEPGRGGQRDQAASAFALALARLCESLPAVAAALVDREGETVDYAGELTPFEIRIAAAEWRIVLENAVCCTSPLFRAPSRIVVRAGAASFCAITLSEGYALIARLPAGAFSASDRAISEAIREVCREAALPVPTAYRGQRWIRVNVQEGAGHARRPEAIHYEDKWQPVEILGRYHGADLGHRELGFRVRLANGLETTLVRERLGRWFSDHLTSGAREA